MENQNKTIPDKPVSSKHPRRLLIIAVAAVAIIVLLLWRSFGGNPDDSNTESGWFTVTRSDLTISVIENGNIKALNSKDIKSEVEGRTTIISLIDEGSFITQEDVDNGLVLVELDSSQIDEKLATQKIKFLDAKASYADANEALLIQEKENASDIQAGRMKLRFALIDFQKYLGRTVAQKFIGRTKNPGIHSDEIVSLVNDTNILVNDPNIGGDTLQEIRKLNGDIKLKEVEFSLAEDKFEWTKKLYKKEYASRSDLEAAKLLKDRREIEVSQAKTAKELFIKYEFPKQTEKYFSDYHEAGLELERVEARARSKLTQAQARLGSKEATYFLETRRLDKLSKQFNACVIKAPAPGEVIYSSTTDHWARNRGRVIEIGAEVRQRQNIISIPDTSQMKVEIRVHETWIDKILPGQKTRITAAAFPGQIFSGKVIKKAPMADPEDWMNPDLKVYSTDVSIDGTHDFLKTGMSAKVEIIIEELKDVISIPIQTVINLEGKKICYVANSNRPTPREVVTGAFNDNFVEITQGLSPGEKVLLNPPRLIESYLAEE